MSLCTCACDYMYVKAVHSNRMYIQESSLSCSIISFYFEYKLVNYYQWPLVDLIINDGIAHL